MEAGVREYWILDPYQKNQSLVEIIRNNEY